MCSFAGRKILQRLLQGRAQRKGSRNPVRLQAPRLRARLAGVPTKVILHHRDTEAQSNTKRKRSSVPPCLSDGPASPTSWSPSPLPRTCNRSEERRVGKE